METQISQILSIQNPFTQNQVKEGLQRWPSTLQEARKRSQAFSSLKKRLQTSSESQRNSLHEDFKTLETATKTLEPLLRESTDVEKEGYSQVCF